MECYYHPSRESSDVCAICGKSICKECGLEIAGKIYCKDCLEKIVGLSMDKPQEEPVQEPTQLERQEPQEVQFSKIADDSPYNIKENIQYEGGLESRYEENYPPKDSLYESIENIQTPQEPVQDVRQEYVQEELLRQPADQARNEYDYVQRQAQAPQTEGYIYPDHSYQPGETSARQAVEDKYERYLDDLYFDENEVPLNEQLARDEEKFGSLTRNEYQPRYAQEPQPQYADDDLERRIREELMRKEQGKKGSRKREPIHNIQYEEEKEPYGITDILLTIVLVIVILIVLFYLVYLFKLSSTYPTFMDAVFGLRHPGMMMNALLH